MLRCWRQAARHRRQILVPMLRVGMPSSTLCVAESGLGMRYHNTARAGEAVPRWPRSGPDGIPTEDRGNERGFFTPHTPLPRKYETASTFFFSSISPFFLPRPSSRHRFRCSDL